MRWLKRVIALVLQGKDSRDTAQQTQLAGLVRPEPMTQAGSKPSARTTSRRSQPASQTSKPDKTSASQTRQGAKHTLGRTSARTLMVNQSKDRGN